MKETTKRQWLIILLGIVLVAIAGVKATRYVTAERRFLSHSPVSTEEGNKHLSISLPDLASNIYVASYEHLQESAEYFRCCLSVSESTKYVENLRAKSRGQLPGRGLWGKLSNPFAVTPDQRARVNMVGFKDADHTIDWFDVHQIEHGVAYPGGQSGIPAFWIDTDRQLLYCQITD